MQTLKITSEPDASPEDLAAVRSAVDQFNVETTNLREYYPLAIFLRDTNGAVQGGVLGDIWGGWMHVTFLWVTDVLRHQGYGSRLLKAAEDEARTRGCRGVFLETFSFQARPFYERFGYEIVGQLPDCPTGHIYYFMRKTL